MKKSNKLIAVVLSSILIFACASSTKKEIIGKWAYSGSTYCTVTFYENGTMKIERLFSSAMGKYSVDGKTILVTYDDGRTTSLYYDGSSVLANDGSEYRKVSDRP